MSKKRELNQEDMEMAKYIADILFSEKIKVMSWGFHKPRVIPNGLQFNVQGYVHTGVVAVIYNHGWDLFLVRLLNSNNELVKEIDMVYFDDLLDLIDEKVESGRYSQDLGVLETVNWN
jgi:hypothetical protein